MHFARKGAVRTLAAAAIGFMCAFGASAHSVTVAVGTTFSTLDPYDAPDGMTRICAKSIYEGLFTFDKNTNVRKPNNRARGTLISLNKALFDADVGIPFPGDIIGGVVVGEVEHMSFVGDDGKARTIATVRRFDPVGSDMTVFSEIDQYYIGREDEEE